MPPDAPPAHWHTIWEDRHGIWNVLTEAEWRHFPLEQLAINWAEGRAVTA